MVEPYDNLIIRQLVEPIEILTGGETRNKYRIIDPGRRDILFAFEESGFVKRQLFGSRRPMTLKVIDMEGNLQLTRGVSSPDSSRIWTCLTRRGAGSAP